MTLTRRTTESIAKDAGTWLSHFIQKHCDELRKLESVDGEDPVQALCRIGGLLAWIEKGCWINEVRRPR